MQVTRDVLESVYRQLAQRQPAAVFQDRIVFERNANLRVVQTATAPVIGRSMAISYAVGGLVLGLLLGAAAAAIATLLRQVYVFPEEAERDLHLPALASLESRGSHGSANELPAVADLSSLLQEVTVDGRRLGSLQIIGVSEQDDRVAIVRGLATDLACRYERRTLILDLDGSGTEIRLSVRRRRRCSLLDDGTADTGDSDKDPANMGWANQLAVGPGRSADAHRTHQAYSGRTAGGIQHAAAGRVRRPVQLCHAPPGDDG